jgi:RNA polymerase sigma factor (TIGR02999 family)
MNEVTGILSAIERGDPKAAEELLPLVYDELRRLAARHLAREQPGQTLQPTALVHEAYVRLVDGRESVAWDHRGHFFAAAAESMRRILVENARRKHRLKRGGGLQRVELQEGDRVVEGRDEDLLTLDEALARLEAEDAAKAALVKLRVFAGLTLEEAAAALGISRATASRYWTYARAWLYHRVRGGEDEG